MKLIIDNIELAIVYHTKFDAHFSRFNFYYYFFTLSLTLSQIKPHEVNFTDLIKNTLSFFSFFFRMQTLHDTKTTDQTTTEHFAWHCLVITVNTSKLQAQVWVTKSKGLAVEKNAGQTFTKHFILNPCSLQPYSIPPFFHLNGMMTIQLIYWFNHESPCDHHCSRLSNSVREWYK